MRPRSAPAAHLSSNRGFRFSTNAATPSAKSCVRAQQAVGEALELQADGAARPARVPSTRLAVRSASAGRAASSSARLATAAPSSARGTTSVTSPQASASAGADAAAAQHHVLGARDADQLHEPLGAARAGDHPQRDLGQRELRRRRLATRKSQASASSSPTPKQ